MEFPSHHGDSRITRDNKIIETLDDVLVSELERDQERLEGGDYDKGPSTSSIDKEKLGAYDHTLHEKPEHLRENQDLRGHHERIRTTDHEKIDALRHGSKKEKVAHERLRDETLEARERERIQREEDKHELESQQHESSESTKKGKATEKDHDQSHSNQSLSQKASKKVSDTVSKAKHSVSDAAASANEKASDILVSAKEQVHKLTNIAGNKEKNLSTNPSLKQTESESMEKGDRELAKPSLLNRVTDAASNIADHAKNIMLRKSDATEHSASTNPISTTDNLQKKEAAGSEKTEKISDEMQKGKDQSLGQQIDKNGTSIQEKAAPLDTQQSSTDPSKTDDPKNTSLLNKMGDLFTNLKEKIGLDTSNLASSNKSSESTGGSQDTDEYKNSPAGAEKGKCHFDGETSLSDMEI